MSDPLYLDAAASARPYPECAELAREVSLEDFANPGSIHGLGSAAARSLDQARKSIISRIVPGRAGNDFECVFTSGATEGNNIAIMGAARANRGYSKRIVTTTAEHDSVLKVFERLSEEGFEVLYIPVHLDGDIDWDRYREILSKPVGLISAIAVSNQNGAILPIARMAKLAKELSPRVIFHTDATQAICKVASDYCGVDLLTFSGHKIGGMRGSGALLKRKRIRLIPPEVGGGQEQGIRSGTVNTPGALSLELALRMGTESLGERKKRALSFRQALVEGLSSLSEYVSVLSPDSCSPFVTALGLKRHKASTVVQYLSSQGIYVSTTSACDSTEDGPNRILRGMGVPPHEADNPIRVSILGIEETPEDAGRLCEALSDAFGSLRPEI